MPSFRIPTGIALRLDHYLHGDPDDGPNLGKVLDALEKQQKTLDKLVIQGGTLMATVTQLQQELQGINTATNRIAATNEQQAATLTEVSADIDNLLARVPDLPESLRVEAGDIRAKLEQAAALSEQQAQTLRGIADKHTPATEEPAPPPTGEPVPPPTEEPPPPVEG